MEQTVNNDRKTAAAAVQEYASQQTTRQSEHIKPGENQLPSHQFQTFLARAEASAKNNIISRKWWKLFALVSLMLLAATIYAAVWAYSQVTALTNDRTAWV